MAVRFSPRAHMEKIKYKIGVMGSAGRGIKLPRELLEKSREVGREIARNGCILITGACMGTPHEAAVGAGEEGGLTIGFSPAATLKEHIKPPISYPPPPKNSIYIYTGIGKEGRILLSIRNCDGIIIIGGGLGTLIEFSIAYYQGKVIGILEGTNGIAEKIPEIVKTIKKETEAMIIFDSSPKNLVRRIIKLLKKRK